MGRRKSRGRVLGLLLFAALASPAAAHGGKKLPTKAHGKAYEAVVSLGATLDHLSKIPSKKNTADTLKDASRRLKQNLDADGYWAAMDELRATLAILMVEITGGGASKKRMKAATRQLNEINEELVGHLGPMEAAELKRNQRERTLHQKESVPKRGLAVLRSAASIYYGDKEGVYPPSLDALTKKGRYLSKIPAIAVGGHPLTNDVLLLRKFKSRQDIEPLITDQGGWIYVSDDDSPHFGTIYINCSHTDSQGNAWYRY